VLRREYSDEYPYQLYEHNQPDSGAAGLAILSKFPVINAGWHPSPNGWYPGWYVHVQTPAGTIQILNLHLRSAHTGNGNVVNSYLATDDDHLTQITSFYDQGHDDLPWIVLGDFNEGVDGAAVEYLEERGFTNALPLFRPGQFTWRHDSVANQFTQTLDHILFDHAFEPLNAWVVDDGRSDHLPVIAHLEASYQWAPDVVQRAAHDP
jgi:endonuclease/exonuclease/phosphatase family metal-dependent hydrolase